MRRIRVKVTSWFFVLALIATQTLLGIAQETPLVFTNPKAVPVPPMDEQTAHDRSYAMELYAEGKCEEAFPWLKKVIQAAPDDAVARKPAGSSGQHD
jgi:hypothetical protein